MTVSQNIASAGRGGRRVRLALAALAAAASLGALVPAGASAHTFTDDYLNANGRAVALATARSLGATNFRYNCRREYSHQALCTYTSVNMPIRGGRGDCWTNSRIFLDPYGDTVTFSTLGSGCRLVTASSLNPAYRPNYQAAARTVVAGNMNIWLRSLYNS